MFWGDKMGHRPTTLWCEYGKEFTWAYLFPTIKTMHSMNVIFQKLFWFILVLFLSMAECLRQKIVYFLI